MKKIEKLGKTYKNENKKDFFEILLGADEVGRGPLAGPVTVCISSCVSGSEKQIKKELAFLAGKKYPIGKDSKKMTEQERDFWFMHLTALQKKGLITFFLTSKSAQHIDKNGIAVSIKEALDESVGAALVFYKKLEPKLKKKDVDKSSVDAISVISATTVRLLADAGLKTSHGISSQKSIVKGDEKEFVISIASVYAKVSRDRYMKNLSKKIEFSKYGFEVHKGYGTAKHRKNISVFGISKMHRVTFCKNIDIL